MSGDTSKKGKRVRLDDIAAKCGVSISTVSRALSGEKGVRPEIRQRIIAAASTASYAVPASIAGNKVMLIASSAAMIDYVRNQFTWHVLEGLNARASVLGIEIIMRPIGDSADQLRAITDARDDAAVGGVLILTIDDEAILAAGVGMAKPVVMVNGDDPQMRLSSVTPCNRSAAHLATQRLIDAGHEKILFLMRRGRRTIERRAEGWRDALLTRGLGVDPASIVEVSDWLPDLAAQAIKDYVARNGLCFSAILTAGDSLAAGAIEGLRGLGLNVPQDVSVMGMDDLPQSAFLNPPLTTVHIPMREIGSTAVDLLRDMMLGLITPARRIELACRIVERGSVGGVSHSTKPSR